MSRIHGKNKKRNITVKGISYTYQNYHRYGYKRKIEILIERKDIKIKRVVDIYEDPTAVKYGCKQSRCSPKSIANYLLSLPPNDVLVKP